MMATPSFPFKRTRNFLHSCLFLFSLETVSTVWNRGLRCPSTTSRQSSFCDVSFRCAIRSVSVCCQGSPKLGSPVSTIGCECLMSELSYSAHQINLVKGPCSVQLEAMLLCRGLRSPHLYQLFLEVLHLPLPQSCWGATPSSTSVLLGRDPTSTSVLPARWSIATPVLLGSISWVCSAECHHPNLPVSPWVSPCWPSYHSPHLLPHSLNPVAIL